MKYENVFLTTQKNDTYVWMKNWKSIATEEKLAEQKSGIDIKMQTPKQSAHFPGMAQTLTSVVL